MNGSVFATISLLFCFTRFLKPTQGGICWLSMNKSGRCLDVLSMNISKEDCCRQLTNANSAWSEDVKDGRLFLLRALGGGVPCQSCRVSCTGVVCDPDKKCVMRGGRPKCVCTPCKGKGRRQGPVCGTDGNSYPNVCQLKKQACKKKISNLSVAYTGYCQSSCDKLACPEGMFCIVDQNLSPHCVRCPECPADSNPDPEHELCGSDGKTYHSICQLRYAACTTGKGIPIAYWGKCREKASCENITCRESQLCLTEPVTGAPRCVTCDMEDCPASLAGQRREFGGPICGSNNRTYDNWCQMKKEACETGIVIETKSSGVCRGGNPGCCKRKNESGVYEDKLGFS